MNIRQLETLVWVAALRSFHAAALRLNITQPAVSARIAALESELNGLLFDRTQAQPTLTSRGEEVARYAQEVLKLTRTLTESDANRASAAQATVRVGAIPTLSHAWLPDLIELIRLRFPSVEAEVVVETSDNLRRRLSQRELDVAFLFGPSFDNDVRSVWLGNATIAWAASPKLGLDRKRLSAADIAAHTILTYESGSPVNHEVRRMFRERGIVPSGFISTNASPALLQLIRQGCGVAAVSSVAIDADCKAGLIEILDVDLPLPTFEVFASYLGSAPDPISRVLVDLAIELSKPYHLAPIVNPPRGE